MYYDGRRASSDDRSSPLMYEFMSAMKDATTRRSFPLTATDHAYDHGPGINSKENGGSRDRGITSAGKESNKGSSTAPETPAKQRTGDYEVEENAERSQFLDVIPQGLPCSAAPVAPLSGVANIRVRQAISGGRAALSPSRHRERERGIERERERERARGREREKLKKRRRRVSAPLQRPIEEEKQRKRASVTRFPDHPRFGDICGDKDGGFLQGLRLHILVFGLCMLIFLISIDRTIITTAIPFITSEFHSTADTGWYGSSYLITACAFQPLFGRVYSLFNVKWSYIFSMLVFGIGSLVCALAPSSASLIIGRAVAGFGSAGILTGSFVIIAVAVPLQTRPVFTAMVGLIFGFGATVGPVIGGAFTDLVTWRWCFWINLPICALPIFVMLCVFHYRTNRRLQLSVMDRILALDLVGNAIFLTSSVMLFLALEDAASNSSSSRIAGLLVGFVVTAIIFVLWLWWKQDGALLPPAILMQRTVSASCMMAFFTYGVLLTHSYFLPIWFQAIKGNTAIESGVDMIPYVVSNAFFSLIAGIFVSKTGYFTPPAIIGSAIGTIGCGTISLYHPSMSAAMWAGFQILTSAGFGMSIQQGFNAVQTVLQDEVAICTAAVIASQSLGGAIFVSVGNAVFQSRLRAISNNDAISEAGIDVQKVIDAGATAFRHLIPADLLPIMIDDYHEALQTVFMVAIPLGCLAFLSCCCLEWKSMKDIQDKKRVVGNTHADTGPI